ncbi:MAG: His/Gly/Thr/Pro-type tRNA ligase C-terminal domain-containing protein, partial [Bacteroidota bacterium]
KVAQVLDNSEIRALVDERNEKTGKKIRDAELMKVPYMLIVGEKEEIDGTVSVRKHGQGDMGTYGLNDFITLITEETRKQLE